MDDQEGVVDFKLDTLTQSVRFAAGIAPKAATRVSLGVALAIEDSATDPAGELLGVKLHQGAAALASSIGSIASSVRDGVRAGAQHLGASDGALSKVPALEGAREFVAEAACEVRDAWESAGRIDVQVEASDAEQPRAAMSAEITSEEEVNS